MPITSIAPSAVISPTSASTLEVPISRPTITFLSAFLAIGVRCVPRCHDPARTALPAHCEAVAVAHINVGDVRGALAHQLRGCEHEALEALIDLLAAQAHPHAVVEREAHRAALIE